MGGGFGTRPPAPGSKPADPPPGSGGKTRSNR